MAKLLSFPEELRIVILKNIVVSDDPIRSEIWTSKSLASNTRWRTSDEYYAKARKFRSDVLSTFETPGLSHLAREIFYKQNTFDFSNMIHFHLFLTATTALGSLQGPGIDQTWIRRIVVWVTPSEAPFIRNWWQDLRRCGDLESLVFVLKPSFPYFGVPHNQLQGNPFLGVLADLARARYAESALRLQDDLLANSEGFVKEPGRVRSPKSVLQFSLNENDVFMRLDMGECKTSRTEESLRDQILDVNRRFESATMELLTA
ncbi:hypothetical protein BU16DRAFT_554187 [Lophium mytilinum]|uniref:Uncharacterized protein n=1 Tax=Lophium mytilinum TaxID=390894 RepID=A0A6A6RCL4_9PEZI|nr:hypothetical protein BU16DRAFT_554187 [Lophium mytilinum]